MSYLHFFGLDVSKGWFDVAIAGSMSKPKRFANSTEGIAAFLQEFAGQLNSGLVVLEATGGYETALIVALVTDRIAVHRAAPWQAHSFSRSLGKPAKTDGLDARSLARMAAERHESLRLFVVASQEQGQLSELLMRRADLLAIQVAEKNRAGHPRYTEAIATVRQSLAASLDFLAAQIARLDDQIKALVATAPELHARFKIMTSVIGVGDKTALLLQGLLPELGSLTRRQAASLAGCAPHPRDSGLTRGHRSVFGGRALVKRALFTAAMSARTHDPAMRAFFERLTKAGKPKMVALVAIMRKIIVQINAKLRPPAIAPSW